MCSNIFSKFEIISKIIFESPYFYQMANLKCRFNCTSPLLINCSLSFSCEVKDLLQSKRSSSAWPVSPHPGSAPCAATLLPTCSRQTSLLSLCLSKPLHLHRSSLCLDFFLLSLCKTPMHLSKPDLYVSTSEKPFIVVS